MLACMSEMLFVTSGPRVPPKAGMGVAGANWRWKRHTSCRSLGRRTGMLNRDGPHASHHLPRVTAHLQRCTKASTCARMGAASKDQGCRGARAATARTHRWYSAPQRPHASVLSCQAGAEPVCDILSTTTAGMSSTYGSIPAEPPSRHLHRRRQTPPAAR